MARLLVLDDDPDVLAWMVAAFERRGHEVRPFTRPSAALRELNEWRPDLIVTDILMSEMNGLEFARLARDVHGIPLMFVSVASQRAEAVMVGAVGYVQKPATPTEVRTEVERLLGRGACRNTILIVDDDDAVRSLYHAALDGGFDVLEAEDATSALELLSARRVDLAIVDVHVPEMGGAELIRRLRSTPGLEHLPVIVQTGDQSALTASVWQELHVSHVLEQGDLLEWLASRIDAHLQGRSAYPSLGTQS